jgi:DNA-binding Lrp family transcriptional regulator
VSCYFPIETLCNESFFFKGYVFKEVLVIKPGYKGRVRVMVKTSKEQILEDEKKVLAELKKNSKENIDGIAKHCGFSRQKVCRIIKKLEANNLIWGYTAVTDDDKEDVSHFIMLIQRSMVQLDKKIIDKIDSMKIEDFAEPLEVSIESSCLVHGCYDWVISFTAKNINQAKRFSDILSKGFPGVIERIDILQSLYRVRKHSIFNPNRKKLCDLM